MPLALVETKFFLPPTAPGSGAPAPPRPASLGARRTRLTLVSAPAGFGKTTLLAAWLAGAAGARSGPGAPRGCPSTRRTPGADAFWSYVLTALERAAPGTGAAGLALLGSRSADRDRPGRRSSTSSASCPTTWTSSSTTTTSPRARRSSRAWRSSSSTSRRRCTWSSAPAPTRRCPWPGCGPAASSPRSARPTSASPTTRRRAYLADATGLELDASDVAALEARTEGWIASLQLAAISLRDRDDPSRVHRGVRRRRPVRRRLPRRGGPRPPARRGPRLPARHGDPRPAHRPAVRRRHRDVRGQRRCSSRWSAGTCSWFRSTTSRRWYRYHHLFADVLRAHLLAEQPERVAGLHRRASAWYDEAGEPEPAVRHALAAGDVDARGRAGRAGDPGAAPGPPRGGVPRLGRRPSRTTCSATARSWPSAWSAALMSSNEFDGVEERLRRHRAAARAARGRAGRRGPRRASRGSRRRSRCTAPRSPSTPATPPARSPTPSAPSTCAAEDDDLPRRGRVGAVGPGVLDAPATSRPPTAATRPHRAGCERSGTSPTSCGCSIALADIELSPGPARRRRSAPSSARSSSPARAARPARHRRHATSG